MAKGSLQTWFWSKLSVLKLITDTYLAIYLCEILSKLFNRPVSQFTHLPGGDNSNTSPLMVVGVKRCYPAQDTG